MSVYVTVSEILAAPQAEGLTVKTGKARYTPLFLSKGDLDIALANADGQRCAAEEYYNL